MRDSQKMKWLKIVLLIKVIVTYLVWGLPSLLGPATFLNLFNISMPADPIFLRMFGAVVVAFGVAYWYAYRDPIRNVAIIKVGVVDNGLVTIVILVLSFTSGISSWFFWLSAVLTTFFCVSFIVLMPRRVMTDQ